MNDVVYLRNRKYDKWSSPRLYRHDVMSVPTNWLNLATGWFIRNVTRRRKRVCLQCFAFTCCSHSMCARHHLYGNQPSSRMGPSQAESTSSIQYGPHFYRFTVRSGRRHGFLQRYGEIMELFCFGVHWCMHFLFQRPDANADHQLDPHAPLSPSCNDI